MKIVGLGLLCAFSAFILKGLAFRAAPIFAAMCAVSLLSLMGDGLGELINTVTGISDAAGISSTVSSIVRVIGAGYLFGISSDICRELGEAGIAKAVEVVGRVEIILFVLPHFIEIINVGAGLLGG